MGADAFLSREKKGRLEPPLVPDSEPVVREPPRVAKSSPDLTRAPSPLRKNRSVVGFSVGQRCDCVVAAYFGTGASETACAPGRRPNVGRVWSKHFVIAVFLACRWWSCGRQSRVGTYAAPTRLVNKKRREVWEMRARRLRFGTHRAGLHGGLARGHALDLDVAVPAVRGSGGRRSGAGRGAGTRRWRARFGAPEPSRRKDRADGGNSRDEARTCPRRGHRPRRST